MTDEKEFHVLAIDDDFASKISVEEAKELTPVLMKFIASYLEHKDNIQLAEWLRDEMTENLPEYNADEIAQMSDEILSTLKMQEEKKESLNNAVNNGRSKESWFASEAKIATSYLSAQEASKYLQGLDEALTAANESLYNTIHTQAGIINMNPYLDGFIAEQYHAQTFNLNAEASGSPYRAKVHIPSDGRYSKNSVDIVIVDGSGKVVKRYQSKYCKDPESTAKAFDKGDYRGQQKLVPEGQEQDIPQKTTTILEAPDGTTSKPLTKARAKELQKEAQSGKWNDLNWNEYKTKDLAIGIGKQAGQAALMGAAISAGFEVARSAWTGEEIKGEEIIENAIVSGADFGIKAAASGALKVGVEKGIVKAIPKGTPAATITNIVHVAVEDIKIIGKMATGKLTVKEGFEKIEQTTVATVAGISASTKGVAIGASIGTVFGPVGTAIGGFVGGTIGYMAGSKFGETIVKGVQKIREKAKDVIRTIGQKVQDVVSSFADGIRNMGQGIRSLFSW